MTPTPPGWYDDGHGALRWWDGAQWTEHVHAPASDAAGTASAQPAAAPAEQGYPQQYPGAPGAPTTPPVRSGSKLWILWVVLGGVLVLLVALAALLIPLVIGWLTVAPGDADQRAAVRAVELYDDAWGDADCDDFERSTTADYRESIDLTDCASFEDDAQSFDASTDDYDMRVTDVQTVSEGRIEVVTVETYLYLVDEQGQPLDEPQEMQDVFRYVLVPGDGDDWVIDALDYDE